jgi:hypothetical protein
VVSPFRNVRHRLSVSTSFVLAALRALHVDASGAPALCGWDGEPTGGSGRFALLLDEQGLQGLMFGWVVGDAVLPAVPDDVEPGAGQDAYRVRVVVAPGKGVGVELGCPRVGHAAVAGEVADGVAQLFVDCQRKLTTLTLPDWRVEGAAPAKQNRASGVGNRARQSPISVSRRAARTRPERGRLVKMCVSRACRAAR